MEVMSKTDQRRLLKALDKAADLTKEGMGPNEALAKSAEEYQLTSPMVQRVVEAYNKANAVAYMKTAPESRRGDDYPVASLKKVASLIFDFTRPAQPSTIVVRDFKKIAAERSGVPELAKTAELRTGVDPKYKPNVTAKTVERLLMKLAHQASLIDARESRKETELVERSKRLLVDMANQTARMNGEELRKTSSNLANAFGEESAKAVINAVNAVSENPVTYLPEMPKTAKAVILPDKHFYKCAKQLLDNREKLVGLHKSSDELNPYQIMSHKLMGLHELAGASDPHIDPTTGFSGEWDAYAKSLKSREMLYDLMLNDPDISAYSPRQVKHVFNNIMQTFPELAQKKLITAAVMKKMLAQGGNLDIYEIKDLIGAGKELSNIRKTDVASRKDLNDIMSTKSDSSSSDKKSSDGSKVHTINVQGIGAA